MMMKRKGSFFYGWLIVLFSIPFMGVTHGLLNNCLPQYVVPVSEELGFSRAAFSLCATFIKGIYVLISLFSGSIYRRVKVSTMLRVASVGLPLSYFAFSFCSSLWSFYLISAAAGVFCSFATFLPFTHILSAWFEEKRGTALGICFMGTGLGSVVLNQLVARWINTAGIGWRGSYRFCALIMAAVVIPVAFLIVRDKPEDKGMRPLGAGSRRESSAPLTGPVFSAAVRTPSFWYLAVLCAVIGLSAYIGGNMFHLRMPEMGYTSAEAANAASVYFVILCISKMLFGSLTDRMGAKKSTLMLMVCLLAGLTGLVFCRSRIMLIVLIVGCGLGCSSGTMGFPLLTRYAFGSRDYASLFGFFNAIGNLTNAVALVIANAVFAMTGSYTLIAVICTGLSVIAIVLTLLLRPAAENEKA